MVSHNKKGRKHSTSCLTRSSIPSRTVVSLTSHKKKNFKNGTEFKGRLKRKSIKSIRDIKRFCFCGRRGVNKNK